MLRIIIASTLLVAFAHAGPVNAREKRSPQYGGNNGGNSGGNSGGNTGGNSGSAINSNSMTAPFTGFAAKNQEIVSKQTQMSWEHKAAQGTDIQNQGERVQAQGQNNAVKVETLNTKAVMSGLDDVSKAQDTVPAMMNGDSGDNNNRNSQSSANQGSIGGYSGNQGGGGGGQNAGYNGANNNGGQNAGYNGANNGGNNGGNRY